MFSIQRNWILIQKLVNSDLKPSTDWNDNLSTKKLLLRHDVDFSDDYVHLLAHNQSLVKI